MTAQPQISSTRHDLIYAGKAVDDLSHEELIMCALHFRDAHVNTNSQLQKVLRRMREMERALSEEQVTRLDWWLKVHPPAADGATHGTGALIWPAKWTDFCFDKKSGRYLTNEERRWAEDAARYRRDVKELERRFK